MALGKTKLSPPNSDQKLGLEFLKCQRGLGKKRRLLIKDSGKIFKETLGKCREIESLPQDILVRIICGVEHEDLKNLFNVSKTIREATLIAKKWHFEYTTPRKTLFFRGGLDSMIDSGDEIKPSLLKKYRRSRIVRDKKVSKISIALFK